MKLSKEVEESIESVVISRLDIDPKYKDIVMTDIKRGLDLVEYILQDYDKNLHISNVTSVGFKIIDIHVRYTKGKDVHEIYIPVSIDQLNEVTTIYRISQSIIYNSYLFNVKEVN